MYEGACAFVLGMVESIVRRASGENWRTYVKRLAVEDGEEGPDDDARRLDRKRKKSVSNADWQSPTDGDSRIARMTRPRPSRGGERYRA